MVEFRIVVRLRSAERDDARAMGEDLMTAKRALEDERYASWTEMDAAGSEPNGSRQNVVRLTDDLWDVREEWDDRMTELQEGCRLLTTFVS